MEGEICILEDVCFRGLQVGIIFYFRGARARYDLRLLSEGVTLSEGVVLTYHVHIGFKN